MNTLMILGGGFAAHICLGRRQKITHCPQQSRFHSNGGRQQREQTLRTRV
jgi:hypothetical protein